MRNYSAKVDLKDPATFGATLEILFFKRCSIELNPTIETLPGNGIWQRAKRNTLLGEVYCLYHEFTKIFVLPAVAIGYTTEWVFIPRDVYQDLI